jgi:hypothetical protein
MTYRDDHDAAVMRADAADREAKRLAAENVRIAAELAEAREWLGGPRKRLFLGAGIGLACVALALGGAYVGRITAPDRVRVERRSAQDPLPSVIGAMLANGPDLGSWTLTATRCVSRSDGIQLTAAGSEDYSIWLTNNVTEVETPKHSLMLRDHQCVKRLGRLVDRVDDKPPTYTGHIDLDCSFDGNRLIGRIEFRNCR